jgi:hypothetical protein
VAVVTIALVVGELAVPFAYRVAGRCSRALLRVIVVGTMPCSDLWGWAKATGGTEEIQLRRSNGSMRVQDDACSPLFRWVEGLCMGYFAAEYFARAATATKAERRSYDKRKDTAQRTRRGENYQFCEWVWKWMNLLDLFVISAYSLAKLLAYIAKGEGLVQDTSSALFTARMVLVVRVFRVGDLYKVRSLDSSLLILLSLSFWRV